MSTARRIQLGILAVVFGVLAAAGVAVLVTVRAELIGQVDDQLEAASETLSQIDDSAADEQLQLLRSVAQQPDRASAILAFGRDDEVLFTIPSASANTDDPLPDIGSIGIDQLREGAGSPLRMDAVASSTRYRAIAIELHDNLIVIATPLDDVRSTLGRLTATLFGAALASVAIIGIATTIIIRRAISPIDDMIGVAAAIGHGDLSKRIDTTSSDRDVVRLSNALDDMLHQIEGAFDERQASEDQLRQFVADASHELRTPLATIRGYSELYTTGAATDAEAVERAMTRIRSEAVRTGSLVEDLLLLARLDQGSELQIDDVDLTRVVTDAIADARAIEPGRTIDVSLPADSVVVRGDDDRLRQMMSNLLANTRAHAPGAPVHVALGVDGDHAAIIVRDEGPGMTAAQASHAFDRFWRADETRNRRTGGTGLGLAILASVVDAHHGTVGLETAPGQGAEFRIRVPLQPPRTT